MKDLTALFLAFLLIALPGCAPQPEAPSFGESFPIETVRFVTDNPQALRYIEDTLSDGRFTVSDDGALTITVRTEPEMGSGQFAYRVESTASVVIRGGSDHDAAKGLAAFSESYLLCRKPCVNVGMEMTFTTHSGGIESGIPGWRLTESSEQRIALGVTYQERVYTDANGKPHRAYILTADPQHTTLHYGTANDEYSATPADRQNVMQHMQASVAAGYPVIAAVNGDFFAISGDYHPTGLALKNGQLLTKNWVHGRPYTGVTRDGTFVIETMFLQQKPPENLLNAISGNFPLVIGGKINPLVAEDTEMATTSHPRTLAGLTEEGQLILAVIDGRRSDFSNGATYTDAAHFMLSLGAVTAINHDGGGSSTMIIRNQSNYAVMNNPSDGNLRKVFGSIQLVQKEKSE